MMHSGRTNFGETVIRQVPDSLHPDPGVIQRSGAGPCRRWPDPLVTTLSTTSS